VRSQRVYARGFLHVIRHGREGILSPGISGQTVYVKHPPTARARKAGRASVWRLARWPCPGGGSRISVKGVHVDGRGVVSSLAVYQGRIANRGRGRQGGGGTPLPLSRRVAGNIPAARRVPRLLPPPQGGGQ